MSWNNPFQIDLEVTYRGGIALIKSNNKALNWKNSEDLKHQLSPILDQTTRIIFDLSAVRTIDSSGLGALMWLLRQINNRKGKLNLCGLQRTVRLALELMRMHRLVECYTSVEEAFQHEKSATSPRRLTEDPFHN